MSGPFGAGGLGFFGTAEFYDYLLKRSLRFNDDVNSRLQRTLTSTTNRKTFIWSGWVKRSTLGTGQGIFGTATGATANFFIMQFTSSDTLFIQQQISSSENIRLGTDRLFRDTSAWYHILLAVDTTQATASNRLKLYINGESITDFSSGNATYPSSQDLDTAINNSSFPIQVGAINTGTITSLDGYLAEVHFIDGLSFFSDTSGTANASFNINSFGETKQGIWIPKQYTGSHGTNGFYLNFTDSTTAAGFSSVAYTGPIPASAAAGTTGTVSGVGFQPDFVWIKNRTNANNHQLFDSVRGIDSSGDQALHSNLVDAESTSNSNGGVSSIDADGFTVKAGTDTGTGRSNLTGSDAHNYVAWNWQAGGAPTTDNSAGAGNVPTAGSVKIDGSNSGSALAGTIPATRLSANTTYGFSIVTYTGTGVNGATVAHGLGSAPKMIFIKSRVATSADGNWLVYAKAGTVDETDYLLLNSTALAEDQVGAFNDTAATSDVFSLGTFDDLNQNTKTYVAYCWTDISGYSAVGGYTGNGSSGHAITTGFAPAWLMVKRVDPTGSVNSWYIVDNTRTANMASGNDDLLFANLNNSEGSTNDFFTFTSTGFELNTNSPAVNTGGGEYIYMAFKDTRTNAFFRDQSGNGNHLAATGLGYEDSMPDLPTNNFAVWLPTYVDNSGINNVTLTEGNLKVAGTSTNFDISALSFVLPKSGKWYFEYTIGGEYDGWGFCKAGQEDAITGGNGLGQLSTSEGGGIQQNGWRNSASITTNFGITFTAGQIHQVAIDVDGGKLYYGVNNTYYAADGGGDGNPSAGTNHLSTFDFAGNEIKLMTAVTTDSAAENWNFGQNGTFNNTKVAQGNTDTNRIGDFFYAPPTDFLALCTDNLPDPGVDPNAGDSPEDYFNTVLWTGTGSGQSITGMGFQPDWLWFKSRNNDNDHALFDSVRGATKGLKSNSPAIETTSSGSQDLVSFDSDGFTTGTPANYSSLGSNTFTIATWGWKAGGAASTIAAGSVSTGVPSVASSVSASPESGFSIVTYTTTGVGDITVGHGLGKAPEMIFGKVRDEAYGWNVFALPAGVTNGLGFGSGAEGAATAFGQTAPTTTVFTAGRPGQDNMNFEADNNVVAYCFTSIEGYSKIGGYQAAGGADNSFVYLGFRPAWFLLKRLNSTGDWVLYDNKRDPVNVGSIRISPNLSSTELGPDATNYGIDFLSNGVKFRSGQGDTAADGGTYVYMAFAEQPFKYANAR